MKKYMIGNTHFDPVWLWTWDEAMASIRATFRSALERMKEDKKFCYTFACPDVFEWIRKVDPDMFCEIKERVQDGRWDISEGWWLQPDCYSGTGESYARHGLYGQGYLKDTFGKCSEAVFNVDSFGHPSSIPQLLSKCGMKYYCFVRPEERHIKLENPLFNWKGIDGTVIKSFRFENDIVEDLVITFENYPDYHTDTMLIFGVTDHGGAPTKKDIKLINENNDAVFSTVPQYFENTDSDYEVSSEFLTRDFGVYANGQEVKKLNRIAEYSVLNAERACLFADNNQQSLLSEQWKTILFNQFHDILGGASIADAYFDNRNQIGGAIAKSNEVMHINLQNISKNINTPGSNDKNEWNVVVWNLNGADYDGYVEAEAQWAHEFKWYDGELIMVDGDGNEYETQIIRERCTVPQFRSRFLFKVNIPKFSYKTFAVVKNNKPVDKKTLSDIYTIKTDNFEISISKTDGSIKSVYNIQKKCSIASNLVKPILQKDEGDTWTFNIEDYDSEKVNFTLNDIKVEENGNFRTTLKLEYKYNNSLLWVWYQFYAQENYFDVKYKLNFNESHMVVKLLCETVDNEHQVSIPYGFVNRTAQKGDMPMGEWIKTKNYSIVSNGIFAYSIANNELGLTLVRSCIYGDFRLGELDDSIPYTYMEQGITEGSLRFVFNGNETLAGTLFNNRPIVILESNHPGNLPPEKSYFNFKAEHSLVTTLKYGEYEDCKIIRFYEYNGETDSVTINYNNQVYSCDMKPFEIKTLKITDKSFEEIDITEFENYKY